MSVYHLDESLAAMGLAYPVPAAPAANPVPNPVPANPLPAPHAPDVPAYPVPEWADNRQRSVMEPPYHSRLNRLVLDK